MNFYENWVELDLNPIITFSNGGKVLYYNQNGQFLLDRISSKELYEIAIKYATNTYGFQTSYINLNIKNWSFYAISVGYKDDESLFVKFYKSISIKQEEKLSIKNSILTNIFTIIELNISNQKSKKDIEFIKNYDPSIPEFNLDAPNLLKTIGKAFESFKNATKITTTIKLKIGEYIKIENKKHPLININISSNGELLANTNELNSSSQSFILRVENKDISIDLPMILP